MTNVISQSTDFTIYTEETNCDNKVLLSFKIETSFGPVVL